VTWQHPEASLAPAVVSALSGLKSSHSPLDARKAAWQEALRSLFMALRAGVCHAFYLATSQASYCSGAWQPFLWCVASRWTNPLVSQKQCFDSRLGTFEVSEILLSSKVPTGECRRTLASFVAGLLGHV
jgi:hypothetical protein